LVESSEVEVGKKPQKYVLFIKFEVKAIATVDQIQEVGDDLKK
jgi:hypothetical protein